MNLDALSERVTELAQVLKDGLRKEVETIAQTGLAVVTQRVSETGKNSLGQDFPPYTPAYEQIKRFGSSASTKEGAKKRAERRVKKATADKPVGRYKGFVDFTLTGQMLSSIGIVEQREQGNRVVVRVGGRDQFTKDKMSGNDTHRPGWFRLSKEEIGTLAQQSSERLGIFARNFITR